MKLSASATDQLEKYVSPQKKLNGIEKCFVRVHSIERSIEKPHERIVTFLKSEVSTLDLVHTLAYLTGRMVKTCGKYRGMNNLGRFNPLRLDFRNDFDYAFDMWFSPDKIYVRMPVTILHRIQLGFGCSVNSSPRTRRSITVSSFLWIVRALCDKDECVYRHGAYSLLKTLCPSYTKSFINEKSARLLPDVLNGVGGKDNHEFNWQKIFLEDYYKEDNRVIQSTMAVLIDAGSFRYTPHIYISEEGYKKVKRFPLLPQRLKDYFTTVRKTRSGDYVLSPVQYEYYKWFVDTFKQDDPRGLEFFLCVYLRCKSKSKVSKKRKRKVTYRDFKYMNRMDEVERAHYAEVKKYNNYALPRDGITSLCYLIAMVEIRGYEIRSGRDDDIHLKHHCKHECQLRTDHTAHWIVEYSRDFDPIVQYPKSLKNNVGSASNSFPIIKFSKRMHKELTDILGDTVSDYFFNEDSLRL
tara:strand:+ start:205 stop:1602 length:1398 start_codon:yes stop_codon:yes gene_type:complete